MQLLGEPDAWKVIPEPFSSLWLTWVESSQSKQQPREDNSHEQHLEFIRSLVQPDSPADAAPVSSARSSQTLPGPAAHGTAGKDAVHTAARERQQPASGNSAQEQQQLRQSVHMREAWQLWQQTPEGLQWSEQRRSLPVCQIRAGVLQALQGRDFVVVMGDTGSGKTTQVRKQLAVAVVITSCKKLPALYKG